MSTHEAFGPKLRHLNLKGGNHMQQAQSAAEDTNDVLSQMDIILPAQYFGALGSNRFSSEQRLMLARDDEPVVRHRNPHPLIWARHSLDPMMGRADPLRQRKSARLRPA